MGATLLSNMAAAATLMVLAGCIPQTNAPSPAAHSVQPRPVARLAAPAPKAVPTLEQRAAAFHLDIDDLLAGIAQEDARRSSAPAATDKRSSSPGPANTPRSFDGRFIWPVPGAILARFGPGASGLRNNGIDIATEMATPVKAAADGTVAYAGQDVAVFGGLVLVDHGSGWVTAYGNASRVDVVKGQYVTRGQTLALSGDTGYASRPKLHFEIRKGRAPVDPLTLLPKR